MFDQLLSQMEGALQEAQLAKGPSTSELPKKGYSTYVDATKSFGKVASFSKADRFKEVAQREGIQADPLERVQQTRQFSFSKKERFAVEKQKYTDTPIYPNVAIVKKNTQTKAPILKPPSQCLAASKVSISTIDSDSFRGPGTYNLNSQGSQRQSFFCKDSRFKQKGSNSETTPLFPSTSLTRRNIPSSLIKKKTVKTKQLISKETEEALREKVKMVYWKNVPLQLDRLLQNQKGPVIQENYFDLGKLKGTAKRGALLLMLDRLNYMRGGYQQQVQTSMEAPCRVTYRKSTPKPFKFSQMNPGPACYYPADDSLDNAVAFSFGREGLKLQKKDIDYRQYDIQEDLFKKGGNIIINPPHTQVRLSSDEAASLRRGPGFYDCLFSQVEKRNDIGVIKYQDITPLNDRQNNCVKVKEAGDGVYFPSYQAIDAHTTTPLYRVIEQKKPANMPDKQCFPEHWRYYDGDLRMVRAEIAKNVILAKNMPFDEYKAYQRRFRKFKDYLQECKRGPQPAQYHVTFTAVDSHLPTIDFQQQPDKGMISITKPEGHLEGDNLILHPQHPTPHLANINFGTMEGRDELLAEDDEEPKEGDRLLLNPTLPPKHIPNVFFDKQEGRPQPSSVDEQVQGDCLILDPRRVKPHIANVDLARQAERKAFREDQDDSEETNILRTDVAIQKVKGVPFSRLTSVKLIPLLRQSKRDKDEQGS